MIPALNGVIQGSALEIVHVKSSENLQVLIKENMPFYNASLYVELNFTVTAKIKSYPPVDITFPFTLELEKFCYTHRIF